MSVSLEEVEQISRAVAAEQPRDIERITVASTSADAHRVELLVTLGQQAFEPRHLLINLSRQEPDIFEHQLRARLKEARDQSGARLAKPACASFHV